MKRILLLAVLICGVSSLAAQYTVSGGNGSPLSAIKNGITEVYLLNGMEGAQISFKSSQSGDGKKWQWYRFKESIDNKEPVDATDYEQTGNVSTITKIEDGYGYYIDAPMVPGYIWIVNYKNYIKPFTELKVVEDEYRCERLILSTVANFAPIYYYVNGMRIELLRKFKLTYHSLSWNDEQETFIPVDTALTFNGLYSEIEVNEPPLTNTTFTLTDAFAEHFGIQQSITSTEYQAIKVEAHATATLKDDINKKYHPSEMLGGSAPLIYTFTAYANKPTASMYVWKVLQIDSLTGAQTEVGRDANETIDYTFDRNGTYRAVLEVNGKGFEINGEKLACVDTLAFDVVIDNTVIKIPNAFSPGSSPGVNDELIISTTSVISFKASVFNRWGNLLFQWTEKDNTKGWDGRVNGKFVPTGAYPVVVEYKDSNGKVRTISRMVNILRGNNNQTNQTNGQ